jgi:peroxiredoxin
MTGKTTHNRRGGTRPAGRPVARRRWVPLLVAVAVVAIVAALYGVFRTANPTPRTGGNPAYAIGRPGPGQPAPPFTLPSTAGAPTSLASLRGKSVLLYFQEGLTCQPCWDQLTDLEKHAADLRAAGIDQVVSITTDPVDLTARKSADMHQSTPVLSDPDLTVSRAYHANEYGMMGASRDGHTFILVGPDGTIRWRADYGGAPNYTMFVPTGQLLADLKAGTAR